jgi:wyosine [tRNA(Phe)-imidazoG37] synthetase (radical SAM superfamily)
MVTQNALVRFGDEHVREVADFLARLKPTKAYLAIPTRPPTEKWVEPPDENIINRACQIFTETIDDVEYLIGYEGSAFAFAGNVEEDMLNITAVHPMREEAVKNLLHKAKADWSVIDRLIAQRKLVETEYKHKKFIMRKFGDSS